MLDNSALYMNSSGESYIRKTVQKQFFELPRTIFTVVILRGETMIIYVFRSAVGISCTS